jgi:hypothetical protein
VRSGSGLVGFFETGRGNGESCLLNVFGGMMSVGNF